MYASTSGKVHSEKASTYALRCVLNLAVLAPPNRSNLGSYRAEYSNDFQVTYLHVFTSPVSASLASNALFFFWHHHRVTRQAMIVKPVPAIIAPPPVWYSGSWFVRKKYGVNQCETDDTQFAMAMSAARFVRGLGTTVVSHES